MFKKLSNAEMQSVKGGEETEVTYTGSGSVHTTGTTSTVSVEEE